MSDILFFLIFSFFLIIPADFSLFKLLLFCFGSFSISFCWSFISTFCLLYRLLYLVLDMGELLILIFPVLLFNLYLLVLLELYLICIPFDILLILSIIFIFLFIWINCLFLIYFQLLPTFIILLKALKNSVKEWIIIYYSFFIVSACRILRRKILYKWK